MKTTSQSSVRQDTTETQCKDAPTIAERIYCILDIVGPRSQVTVVDVSGTTLVLRAMVEEWDMQRIVREVC